MIPFLTRYWKPLAGALAFALILWSIHHYGTTCFSAGYAQAQAEDEAATAKLREQVSRLTAQAAANAATAKVHYDDEHAQIVATAAAPVGTRELCAYANDRRERMPEARPAHSGNAATPAAAGVVREVPAPDRGQPGDRRRLLAALAALADEQSAVIREFQARR